MYYYNTNNTKFARNLRRELTPWEKKLWFGFLKNCGQRFVRQKLIGNYIADFYCAKLKLIIELDGSQHYFTNNIKEDQIRTKYFEKYGITVVRYNNNDIDNNFEGVCQDLYQLINNNKN